MKNSTAITLRLPLTGYAELVEEAAAANLNVSEAIRLKLFGAKESGNGFALPEKCSPGKSDAGGKVAVLLKAIEILKSAMDTEAKGLREGRKNQKELLSPQQIKCIKKRASNGAEIEDLAAELNVSQKTIYRYLRV